MIWESSKVSHKRVFALLTPEIHSYEMAQVLQKPVFALPGCQRMSVNTLLCDTLALADDYMMHIVRITDTRIPLPFSSEALFCAMGTANMNFCKVKLLSCSIEIWIREGDQNTETT